MANSLTSLISEQLPRLAELLGSNALDVRNTEFEKLGVSPLWQVERDLQLLNRHLPSTEIAKAYRHLLRNQGKLIEALYEIRVAAMLAPFTDKLELSPAIGTRKCDLKFEIGGKKIFLEVTTREDKFPPVYESDNVEEAPVYSRVTVESSFDSTTTRDDPHLRTTPASKELRDRILDELSQLPHGEPAVLVVGARGGRSDHMEWALWGDEVIRAKSGGGWRPEKVPNGLFRISDEMGGASRLSALVWMKLVPHFHDVRVHGRLFTNPLAAYPLSPEAEEVFLRVFDRRAILQRELERITKILVEKYYPKRIILFGSLADESQDSIHEWSDIDLAVVKSTSSRVTDRILEVMNLLEPRVSLNVVVYTPEEFDRAEREGNFFVRDEILKKGRTLFP